MDDSPASLRQQAITAALSSQWEEALRLNQQIIEQNPTDVDALNRLARAYFELGELEQSKNHFQTALDTDPYNQIAFKFLKRIETFSKKGMKVKVCMMQTPVDSDLFIEEPGKTRLVTLLKLAEPQRLSLLSAGIVVNLVIKNRGLSVTDQNGDYLGVLPDDLAHTLLRLMKGGNKYQAIIKNIKINLLTILVRETYRSTRFKNQPSFLDNMGANLAYSSDHIIVPTDMGEDPLYEMSEEEESI